VTVQRIETEFAGRQLTIETGRLARQASGSALIRFGDTMVLAAITVSPNISNLPFFPLTVEYREKTYAAGKIPGGFLKREGRPSDKEILASRLIDRSIRPLFPEGFKNEVQVFVTVLSADQENDADILGVMAASAGLTLSQVPWNGPLSAVRVGRVEGNWILNPTFQQLEFSTIDLVVSGSADSIVMVEGGSLEISESEMLEALKVAQRGIRDGIKQQQQLVSKVGAPKKMAWSKPEVDQTLVSRVRAAAESQMAQAINAKDKAGRSNAVKAVKEQALESLTLEFAEHAREIGTELDDIEYRVMRSQVLERGERVDGRDPDTIRPITIETGVLPRTHGSALFTRGETQALVTTTLGTGRDAQIIDALSGERKEPFMLHYNFPPFSVNEVSMQLAPKRREIGHGNLARRGISAVMPDMTTFPYVIRVVSEILESNGSSSMASVCGTSLALMDAGVPVKAPVAGVAMGLVLEGDKYQVLTDILGDEDHLGDMDFKVAGTADGVTALQMDIKIEGITKEIMKVALDQALEARLHILGEMAKVLSKPRETMSEWAPTIITMKIDPEKIREVIGKGGAVIRAITEETGTTIDIENDGTVKIASVIGTAGREAQRRIELITSDVEVGRVYEGKVVRLMDFGAFVQILPGKDGLVHISQISDERVERVSDKLKEGDLIRVKVLEVDRQGRVRLSMRSVDA